MNEAAARMEASGGDRERLSYELEALYRLHELVLRLDRTPDLRALLVEVMEAIVTLHQADFGNIQLYDPERGALRLVAQHGFDAAFETVFAEIGADEGSSCGQALARGERVVIPDIETDPGFAPFREAARGYGFCAAQSTPLFGADGEPLGMVSTYFRRRRSFSESDYRLTDLYARQASEAIVRHRREEALRDSEERFRLIVENARDYALFITDADDRIVDWLAGAQAVFGWTAGEAIGHRANILFTPEDREAGEPERELETARRLGHAPDVRWHIRKDGARVFIDGTVSALRDANGAVRGFIKMGQDVTERRRAEDALRESEARFRWFGEASSDVLWIRDVASLQWEYLSAAFEVIYGLDREQALAGDTLQNWLKLILPEDREKVLGELRTVARGERVAIEYRIRRPNDGRLRWLRDTGFPLVDDEGRVRRIGGIGEDVTDEKETADRLTVLVGELQHRTRNLMAVVRSIAERTARGSRGLQDFKQKFSDRMDALARVQSLLSRLKEGDRVAFDELLRDELRAHEGPRVTLEGPSGVLLRSSTVQVLAMAIHELATNAMKYGALAQPRGRLSVRWRLQAPAPGGRLRLRVEWTESGVAIPSGTQSRGGAGRELIERALPYQLDAETSYVLGEDGVRCVISLPVSEHMSKGS